MDLWTSLVPAIIGGVCTLVGGVFVYHRQNKAQTRQAASVMYYDLKYSLQGTTQGNGLTGGVPPVRFSM